jgi:transcriptional regulator with XRE-family HTH domain
MPRAATVPLLFGRRLRGLRTLRKLTQEQLGEKAGVSGKFIGQIERGAGNPSLKNLARLSQALSVELPDLLRFEELRPEGAARNASRGLAAAERISVYLARRPAAEVERAMRILEAAFGDEGLDTNRGP